MNRFLSFWSNFDMCRNKVQSDIRTFSKGFTNCIKIILYFSQYMLVLWGTITWFFDMNKIIKTILKCIFACYSKCDQGSKVEVLGHTLRKWSKSLGSWLWITSWGLTRTLVFLIYYYMAMLFKRVLHQISRYSTKSNWIIPSPSQFLTFNCNS